MPSIWYMSNTQTGYIGLEHPLINTIKRSQLEGKKSARPRMFSFFGKVAVNGSLVRFPQHLWFSTHRNVYYVHRFPNLIMIPYASRALYLFKGPPHLLIHSNLTPLSPFPLGCFLLLPVCIGATGTQRLREVGRTKERMGDILGNPSMWLWPLTCEFCYQLLKVTWEGGWINWGVCASGSTESEGTPFSRIPGPCLSQKNPVFKSQGGEARCYSLGGNLV